MRRTTNNVVTIVITTDTMACGMVQITPSGRFRLHGCMSYPLGNTIIAGTPMQPRLLSNMIQQYVKLQSAQGMDVALCLANKAIGEQFSRMPTSSADGTCVHNGSRISGYQSIAADDHGYYITARADISASLICAYQLLFAQTGLHLRIISGPTTVSLAVYQQLYADAYRQTQLATDLVSCHYQINALLPDDLVDRLLDQPSGHQWEKRIVRYSLGLALGYKEIA